MYIANSLIADCFSDYMEALVFGVAVLIKLIFKLDLLYV